jgi:hypothetical protein
MIIIVNKCKITMANGETTSILITADKVNLPTKITDVNGVIEAETMNILHKTKEAKVLNTEWEDFKFGLSINYINEGAAARAALFIL